MIDLHIHTTNSDGSDAPEEILKKCQQLELEYISITDHDTCKSYDDLKNIDIQKIFKGKIIPGCEFTTLYKGRTIEILGYGINTDLINEWKSKYYSEEKRQQRIKDCKEQLINNLAKLGIHIDINSLDTDCGYDRAVYRKLILKKEENEKILGKGILDNLRFLFRNCISNPEHPIYVDVSKYRPTPKEITDLRKECVLDGVEAFHSTFTLNQMLQMQEYAKRNNLYISGGSDYHGVNKPEIKLKVGSDNLHISKNILEWYKD